MKDGFRQSMAWLHTWVGLVVGWILYFMFLTGTLGYFDTEIDRWMRPELPLAHVQISQREGLELGLRRLEVVAPEAIQWVIYPPSGRDIPNVNLLWRDADGTGGSTSEELDNSSGQPTESRATGGGQALYQMHYLLHYLPSNVAYWLVGLCTMFMLTAIVSGVITHRRIFKDFFTFRLGKGQRSWLDIHNVLSVFALPFHIMITYSGLVFFAFTYMSFVVSASYGAASDDQRRFFDEAFRNVELPVPSGVNAQLASLPAMLARAERSWGVDQVRAINVQSPGDANARVTLTRNHVTPVSNGGRMVFDGASGDVLDEFERSSGPLAVNNSLLGLHEGLFAGDVVRWLYFFAGLLGTAMIATGLVLWTAKRRRQDAGPPHLGLALVERLNVGTIVGLPVAIAGYFWANRLLPVDMAARAEWEVNVLFLVWASMLAYTVLRPIARCWIEQVWIAAALLLGLPLLNGLTTNRHLAASIPAGEWALAGFDLTAIAFGLGFACIALRLRLVSRLRADHPEQKEGVSMSGLAETEPA
jgi:uncharacterized iron-regulated membrane protein